MASWSIQLNNIFFVVSSIYQMKSPHGGFSFSSSCSYWQPVLLGYRFHAWEMFALLQIAQGVKSKLINFDECRSTIVHSNTVPPKEQQNLSRDKQAAEEVYSKSSKESEGIPVNFSRTLPAQQRFPLGILFVSHNKYYSDCNGLIGIKLAVLFSQTRKGRGTSCTIREC